MKGFLDTGSIPVVSTMNKKERLWRSFLFIAMLDKSNPLSALAENNLRRQ